MMPILYGPNETDFDHNGVGILADAVSCKVTQRLNGKYEATLEYPVIGVNASGLINRAIFTAKPDPESDPQLFRIYRIRKLSARKITAYARHIAYDLKGVAVSPFRAQGAAAALDGLKAYAVNEHPFSFETDKTSTVAFSAKVPTAAWDILGGTEGSLLDVFGGEYLFDRFKVKLLESRGEDRGVSIRYGKNISTLEQDESIASCYTAVYPYWVGENGTVVELEGKLVQAKGTHDHVRILTLDLSTEWMEAPSGEQLLKRTQQYISDNDVGIPSVSWKVSHVPTNQTETDPALANLESIVLGDTVAVEFPDLNVSATARVVETEFDAIRECFDSTTLGSFRQSLADTITSRPSKDAVNSAVDAGTRDAVETILTKDNTMTGSLSTVVSVFLEPGIEEATKILRYSVGLEEIEEALLPLFDFNADGVVNYQDAMIAVRAANGLDSLADWEGAVASDVTIKLDMRDPDAFISAVGTNMWGRTVVRKFGANSCTDQKAILSMAYPVGTVIIMDEGSDPANQFGGTWSQLEESIFTGTAAWKRIE